ncbi:MAG: ABC transporter ATP-binding protein [Alphaproteobacteria bacterium]|nr:ABC transporter ATP-binding protein [Alphaproteobacteria bacterium]
MAEALAFDGVSAGYGETVVIEDICLSVGARESITILGRNGVGKTTLLATAMGHTRLHGGRIKLNGDDISALDIHRRALAGIGYVPQEREIFPSLTVEENLHVGARPGRWDGARVFELFPHLAARLGNMGNQLSGGEQQMLSIARALMGNPRLLLMDEPTEGLAPLLVEELQRAMDDLRTDADMAIVLVEQNPRVALGFAERALVMDRGRVIYDGPSAELRQDRQRLEALIGVGKDESNRVGEDRQR